MDNVYDLGQWLAKETSAAEDPLTWAVRAAQPIAGAKLDEGIADGALVLTMGTLGRLIIADRGRSCCEQRFLSTDDDLQSIVGARLVEIDLAAGGTSESESEWGEVHEQSFLKVRTTNGDVTVCAHNEHNGYYGGITLDVQWEDA